MVAIGFGTAQFGTAEFTLYILSDDGLLATWTTKVRESDQVTRGLRTVAC